MEHPRGTSAGIDVDSTGALRELSRSMRSDGRFDVIERSRMMSVLLPRQTRGTVTRFAVMLTLSVSIAVMGLTADSAAVVIGAMLIAPLMTPIMTFSAAVGLGLPRRAVQAVVAVVLGAAWSVALAFLLAAALPTVTIGSEILARTAPDVRDLLVAVAAGAAGAYAIARAELSAALPGVAVAVALVPPLAATGILLQAGRSDLAEGSVLLFATNLFAIAVSGLVVFLATGVIPTVAVCFRNLRLAMTVVAVLVATVAVAVPLTARSVAAARTADTRRSVEGEVQRWIGDRDLVLTSLSIDDRSVAVQLLGSDEPPAAAVLAEELVDEMGEGVEVTVRWSQSSTGAATTGEPPPAGGTETDRVRARVERWLATAGTATGAAYRIVELDVGDEEVVAVVSGSVAPPASGTLAGEVADALGRDVTVTVRWLQELDLAGGSGESVQQRAERLVTAWLGPRRSMRLLGVSASPSLVSVDLASSGAPLGVAALRSLLTDAIGDVRVDVRVVPMTPLAELPDAVPPAIE